MLTSSVCYLQSNFWIPDWNDIDRPKEIEYDRMANI